MVAAAWIRCRPALWRGGRLVAALMLAFGVSWLLGDLDGAFVFLHRGPLVHRLLVYPSGRRGSPPARLTVGAGYVDAVADPDTPLSTAVFAAADARAARALHRGPIVGEQHGRSTIQRRCCPSFGVASSSIVLTSRAGGSTAGPWVSDRSKGGGI